MMGIIFSLFCSLVMAAPARNEVLEAFKLKDYKAISEIYKQNPKKNYAHKDLIMISYSLRKLGYFRQDIKLNIRMVEKTYVNYHNRLLRAIKRGDSVDGDKYPEALKVLYWNLFTSYGQILKGYEHDSERVEKDNKYFTLFSKILSELEFREGKVDKYNDQIIAHRQYLSNKIYHFKTSWSFQYVSWQQEATLSHSTQGKATLIVTNKGFCLGGDAGYENYRFHFYVDGCVLYGAGGVKNNDQALIENYQQSNIPAYGLKAGPGASMIVSSSKSRIGIRLPMIYTVQTLTTPKDDGFKVEQEKPLSFVASLYSRWQFGKWYFQTEFGKYIQQEQAFWGFGVGKEF